jgi:hypothetical protein
MDLSVFKQQLNNPTNTITFQQTMAIIADHYIYTPTAFTNGAIYNAAGTNEGSCKLLSFAKLQQFTEEQTLACFGEYYWKDVLQNLGGADHGNIRNFMQSGWQGVIFEGQALAPKD